MSQFLNELFYDNRFIKSTFPSEVYEAIKAHPGAVADAMAADIITGADDASVGELINRPGSNTRLATGMDAHADKQVDLHVRMRDGSVEVVNAFNPMTKAEFLAGAVKVEKITDTAQNPNSIDQKVDQQSQKRDTDLTVPDKIADQLKTPEIPQQESIQALDRTDAANLNRLISAEEKKSFDKHSIEMKGLNEKWKRQGKKEPILQAAIGRATVFSHQDLAVVGEYVAGSHANQGSLRTVCIYF